MTTIKAAECIGWSVPEHDAISTNALGLCDECQARIDDEMADADEQAYREQQMVAENACNCGATHKHGTEYRRCMCCYGN